MELFFKLHPALMLIICDINNYAWEKHNVELTLTDTISTHAEDLVLGRVSASHRKRIAADIRTNDLSIFVVQDIINYINSKPEYEKYHYLSYSGSKRLAYLHDNSNGEHIHLALNAKFGLPELQETFIARVKSKVLAFFQ